MLCNLQVNNKRLQILDVIRNGAMQWRLWRQSFVSYRVSMYLVMCLHLDTNSVLLLIMLLFRSAISSFSLRHRLHRWLFLFADVHFLKTFHVTVGFFPCLFNLQTTFDNSVSFSYFSYLKVFLWFAYLFLKVVSAEPTYWIGRSFSLLVLIVASYTMLFSKHLPSNV